MASDESMESSSSGVGERPTLPPNAGKSCPQRRTKGNQATERYARPNLRRRALSHKTADSCQPVFPAEPVDPEKDRNFVVDAVHFVLSASSKGCCSLVSKIAEHLKYKISLEEKVLFLNKEVKLLRKLQSSSQSSGRSSPISLESETSRLTKQSFSSDSRELNIAEQDMVMDFVLPGVVPYSTAKNDRVLHDALYKNSNKELPILLKKIYSDAQTQTCETNLREPKLSDRGTSSIPQLDSNAALKDQLKIAQDTIAKLKYQLSLNEKDKSIICTNIKGQTSDELLRVGDRVILRGRGIGTIKYLGNLGTVHTVGLHLDKPVGDCDGIYKSTRKRYFKCPPNCGIFVPLQDVKRIKKVVEK